MKFYISRTAKESGCHFLVPRPGETGYDLCAPTHIIVMRGETQRISTGLRVALPAAHAGLIVSRASLATAGILAIPEVIANSYRGEITVLLNNIGKVNYHVMPGDRIAQLIVSRVYTEEPEEVSDIKRLGLKTPRGEAGPGSSGR